LPALALSQAAAAKMQKYTPPEMNHYTNKKQSKGYNGDLMRAIIE
jgi:hypothetical protein